MKKISTSLLFVLLTGFAIFAQVPEAFNYQAVVRNSSGEIITNTNVAFRISILQRSETGTPVYVETHSVNTNNFGLVNLQIGKGTVVSGVFMPGDWGAASHFLKVEFDKDGGTGYVHLGTSQLLSVPYAFHAQTVAEDAVDDADADPNNEIQALQLSGTQLTLSKNGGTVTLPSSGGGGDNWGTQTVKSDATISGEGTTANPLKVENNAIQPSWANIQDKPGGFADNNDDVEDGDANPNNEIQTLSISGNDLTISDGNTVALPTGESSPWQRNTTNPHSIYYNSGFVGIGTNDPQYWLDVVSPLHSAVRFKAQTGDASLWLERGNDTGWNVIAYLSNGNTLFYEGLFKNNNFKIGSYSNSFKGLEITTAGNVNLDENLLLQANKKIGIGIENPTYPLEIVDDNTSYQKFMINSLGSGLENGLLVGLKKTVKQGFLWNFENGPINIGTNNVNRMVIDAVGNIGIGTTNPERILHLSGANPRILIEATSSNPEINFISTGDLVTDIWAIYKNSSTGDLHFYQNGNKLTLQKNTGNVGIGTTTPQGKLDVNGTIYQRGGVLHADYVFEENYKLETIEEHADFMWKNKHLPAIPKATVDENGFEIVEVGSHRKGIVEELEKAHIYISQLKKELKQQNSFIKDLKTENENLSTKVNNQESRLEKLESKIYLNDSK